MRDRAVKLGGGVVAAGAWFDVADVYVF